ncbi:MAG: aspartyl/glutamyl-tRNA amidotransferase subunit C, partial [Actinobacteria bacterium]|nr:aspartyl/glutamyl-tRNA amidotransferase subunit C [Actinomycetota bacterium]
MTQRITRDEVVHVARLARLSLSDAEIDEFTGQLGDILEHAADIEALDVGDVEPTS